MDHNARDGFPLPAGRRAREAFCFNLDAELELADPRHVTPRRMARLIARRVPALHAELCPGDVAVLAPPTGTAGSQVAAGLGGRAWCPTTSALAALRAAGADPVAAPTMAVLRSVNDRSFGLALERARGNGFGAELVTDLDRLAQVVGDRRHSIGFRLKPALSFAGRGHRRLACAPSASDIKACTTIVEAGCLVEPEVTREGDFSLHGFVTPAGRVRLGMPVRLFCDRAGAYRGSELAPPGTLGADELEALHGAAAQAAEALANAGYHGPFGIDAFRYRAPSGKRRFRPLVELNARYTMAWAAGFHHGA